MKYLALFLSLIALTPQLRAAETNPANTPAIPNLSPGPEYADNRASGNGNVIELKKADEQKMR